ncbi:MAG TPA: PQQ-binding-like beta-propeller repeat protein [Planctomycetota bacterium]|nr:PQQ-binding-like beta-propeller repeat protein [Planctomycetota bacterium]
MLIRPGSSGLFEKLRILERSVAESRDDLRTLVRLGIERRRRGDVSGAYDAFLGARALSPHDENVRRELDLFPAWPSFRGGAGRTGTSATRAPRKAPRIRWVRPLDGSVHVSTPTAVAAATDRVFATVSRDVYAVSENGLEPSRPKGSVIALDADDGSVLWTHQVLGLPSAPTHAGDLVLVHAWRGYTTDDEPRPGSVLLALDAQNGALRFRIDLPAEERIRPLAEVHPPLALEDRAVVATTPFLADEGAAYLACIDLRRGELVWQVERSRLEGDIAASRTAVYARSANATGLRLESLSVRDGRVKFSVPVTSGKSLVASAGRVFALEEFPRDRLVCFDEKSGKLLWQTASKHGRYYAPVVTDQEVLLPAESPQGTAVLQRLDLATGKKLDRAPESPVSSRSGISVADGVIVGSGGAVGLARDAFERVLWREMQIRVDLNAGEDLAVAHGRIFGISRSGVAFCFDEK